MNNVCPNQCNFHRTTHKLATRENYASEKNKCTLFVVILQDFQVKTLIAIVHGLQEKKRNNIEHTPDFYYLSQFYVSFLPATMAHMQYLMHIYLFGVSINRIFGFLGYYLWQYPKVQKTRITITLVGVNNTC